MRNLIQYPVTSDETVLTLTQIRKECMDEGLIGDMRPLILSHVIDFINSTKEFDKFLQTKEEKV